jgi:C-terminal processing protease CtpA/Prc
MLSPAIVIARLGLPNEPELAVMKSLALVTSLVALFLAGMPAAADIPPPYEVHGIGAELKEAEPFPVVSGVSKDSPADQAGVRKGDAVIAIDGAYPKGVPFYFFARGLKGKKGTSVELVLLREERRVLVVKVKRSVRDR